LLDKYDVEEFQISYNLNQSIVVKK